MPVLKNTINSFCRNRCVWNKQRQLQQNEGIKCNNTIKKYKNIISYANFTGENKNKTKHNLN